MSTVDHNAGENRYEISVDGELAGFTAYRDHGAQRVFHHTEIGDAFGGRGLSTELVARALADTRDAGKRIVGVCPFVAAYLRKHPELAEYSDPATADVLQWLDTELD
ncbi:GNAT family N-acetyltransferase [Amycolatopsis minnesotensis]|uniref:N-acetyltransferase n=1 Tax=Amycolatopsis minnesotensis TaxID=337894 RepID=A0ABN2RME6_9PSEU